MTTPATTNGTPLDTKTVLAFERTRVAYENTMLAWIRTGTSLITFGFGVYKFFQLELPGKGVGAGVIGPRGFGAILIGTGLLSLALGMVEHRLSLARLRELYPAMPRSMAAIIAPIITVLGSLALVAVLVRG